MWEEREHPPPPPLLPPTPPNIDPHVRTSVCSNLKTSYVFLDTDIGYFY